MDSFCQLEGEVTYNTPFEVLSIWLFLNLRSNPHPLHDFHIEMATDTAFQNLSFGALEDYIGVGEPVYLQWFGNTSVSILVFPMQS